MVTRSGSTRCSARRAVHHLVAATAPRRAEEDEIDAEIEDAPAKRDARFSSGRGFNVEQGARSPGVLAGEQAFEREHGCGRGECDDPDARGGRADRGESKTGHDDQRAYERERAEHQQRGQEAQLAVRSEPEGDCDDGQRREGAEDDDAVSAGAQEIALRDAAVAARGGRTPDRRRAGDGAASDPARARSSA
jgi:hypothetical protein